MSASFGRGWLLMGSHNPDSRFSRNRFKWEEQNERWLTLRASANRVLLSVIL